MTMQADRAAWLNERRKGIGGSDVAAVLGLSPWKTPLQVYLDKRGEAEETPDNEAMLWGRVLEPVIRQQYAERTGRTVLVPETILSHPQHGFMLANLDGITDDRRVVEIKTSSVGKGWGEPGSDEIPEQYLLQVQHYMAVTGCDVADVAVLIGGSDFRLYEVPADRELHEMLVDAEADFWQRVIEGIPPEPVNHTDMVAKFGRCSIEHSVEAGQEEINALRQLKEIRAAIKALEADEEAAKIVIMRAMGQNDTLASSGKILATWKLAKASSRFDAAGFKSAHPDLYGQFLKVGEPSRRFLIK